MAGGNNYFPSPLAFHSKEQYSAYFIAKNSIQHMAQISITHILGRSEPGSEQFVLEAI